MKVQVKVAKATMEKFERDCQMVAERHDLGEVLFCRGEKQQDPFEDDGFLHVVHRGTRAVFDVSRSQMLTGVQQNQLARAVLTDLGLDQYINGHTLVEEREGDEEE